MSQRIFIVSGAKGGVGATTIAIKLIARLPAPAERMIVDGDLTGKRSLAVWYDLSDDLDRARSIGTATVAPAPDGTLVMELARTYEDGLTQTAASVTRALAGLSEHAVIVVDAPQPFAAIVRPFVARATKIIVITEPSPMGVAGAQALLAAMDRAGMPRARIALVMTDINARGSAVSRADIERDLKMPLTVELPVERDRRFEGLFDGLVTMLIAVPGSLGDPGVLAEKPAFDRRVDLSDAFS